MLRPKIITIFAVSICQGLVQSVPTDVKLNSLASLNIVEKMVVNIQHAANLTLLVYSAHFPNGDSIEIAWSIMD